MEKVKDFLSWLFYRVMYRKKSDKEFFEDLNEISNSLENKDSSSEKK